MLPDNNRYACVKAYMTYKTTNEVRVLQYFNIAGFHTRDQLSCIPIKTKEKVCMRIEFNSKKICQGHGHGRHSFVKGHKYGRHDVIEI